MEMGSVGPLLQRTLVVAKVREGWCFSDQAGQPSKLPLVPEQQAENSMALSNISHYLEVQVHSGNRTGSLLAMWLWLFSQAKEYNDFGLSKELSAPFLQAARPLYGERSKVSILAATPGQKPAPRNTKGPHTAQKPEERPNFLLRDNSESACSSTKTSSCRLSPNLTPSSGRNMKSCFPLTLM